MARFVSCSKWNLDSDQPNFFSIKEQYTTVVGIRRAKNAGNSKTLQLFELRVADIFLGLIPHTRS